MGAMYKAKRGGMARVPPPALTLSLVKGKQSHGSKDAPKKVVSIVVAAAIAKDGELLALPFGVRYGQDDLAMEGEERA